MQLNDVAEKMVKINLIVLSPSTRMPIQYRNFDQIHRILSIRLVDLESMLLHL